MADESNSQPAPLEGQALALQLQHELQVIGEIRTLESVLLARARFARQSGLTFEGYRDEYRILGYDVTITLQQMRDEYARGGIAGRVVDVMPNATWRGQPAFEIIEDENPEVETPFEKAWLELDKKHQIGNKLLRVDKLARLSQYAVLLIGDGGPLETPLKKAGGNPNKLLYLMPFIGGGGPSRSDGNKALELGSDATIDSYDEDPKSSRFGLPQTYRIRRTDLNGIALARPVHWTRIIHVAEGLLDDEVFGQPALERIWNLLIDLRKVTGGGAEAFWLRANQGMQLDVDKDMPLNDATHSISLLKEQMEDYKHQITRTLRTRGVKVEMLGSDVANFDQPADAIITQIAGATGIPKRILTGSEMGELASSQDRENFRDLVVGRQMQYAGPYIARALVDRLIEYGYLPLPKGGPQEYEVKWPHMQVMTETEKTAGAVAWASVNSTFGDLVFTDAEIRDKWAGLAPLTDEQKKERDDRAAEKQEQAMEQAKQQAIVTGKVPPEDEKDAKKEKLRAAAEGRSYKFSSTQVQLPANLAEQVLLFGKSLPAFDLCEEEGGLEDDIHITVKYGLHTNDADEVRKALATYVGPIRFTLGKTNIFIGKDYDVLYVEVISADLMVLNSRLSDRLEVTTTYPTYTPHVTVAYLKSGLGVRYRGLNVFEGMSATVGSVRFSPALGPDVDLRITGRSDKGTFALASVPELASLQAAEDMELLRTLTAAIECGATDIVAKIVGLGGPGSGAQEGHPFYGNQYSDVGYQSQGPATQASNVLKGEKGIHFTTHKSIGARNKAVEAITKTFTEQGMERQQIDQHAGRTEVHFNRPDGLRGLITYSNTTDTAGKYRVTVSAWLGARQRDIIQHPKH